MYLLVLHFLAMSVIACLKNKFYLAALNALGQLVKLRSEFDFFTKYDVTILQFCITLHDYRNLDLDLIIFVPTCKVVI